MKNKKFLRAFVCFLAILCLIYLPSSITAKADENWLYLGGFPAGFTIKSKGADIVGLSDVICESGVCSPAKNAGVLVGDRLLNIDSVEISTAKDIELALKNNKGENVVLKLNRRGEEIIKEVLPVKDISGAYKLGLFIRDNLNGIGTMTFVKENGEFMALGHPVVDERNNLTEVVSGELYKCSIIGVKKGVRGKAGELKGVFIKDNAIGMVCENLNCGLKGKFNKNFNVNSLKKVEIGECLVGSAKMITSIDGSLPTEYDISIVKVDSTARDNKNFVVKVNDERLLSYAGGIVQGMSGSPVIQNGKIVGAVTHVFLNDPTRGFGIFINNMLK